MPERLKAILDKITAWWKKFNTKQRSVLISIVAVVIVALVKGEIGLIVDEVCEVVTLVVDEIDKPNIDASSTGKELFINGIGKNGDELISLFEIGSIVSDKDAN